MNVLNLIDREKELFVTDVLSYSNDLDQLISKSTFLVIGGAGSIGQAVTKELFKRNPSKLHIVDPNENNLVELVRDLRSSLGYITGEFKTFAIDCGSLEFVALMQANKKYDYVLNLSALKHVRAERDPYTLMRMLSVNVFNTINTVRLSHDFGATNYFCVSTDKAANPVNLMGASKRIMEMFLMRESVKQPISMARFANVAFSDGSLLHGFNQRIQKFQPISAPYDVKRYFVTPKESGELCMMSALLGCNRDIFFPKLGQELKLTTFADIARRYLNLVGYEPYECSSEDEARSRLTELTKKKQWPCYFFESDTTGEKDFEEFYTEFEKLDLDMFTGIGIIKNKIDFDETLLKEFSDGISSLRSKGSWTKDEILKLYYVLLPDLDHKDTGKYLDQRM